MSDSCESSSTIRVKLKNTSPSMEEQDKLHLVHARPVHLTEQASPFSKESHEENFRGFLNLAVLLLVVNMLRLILENYQKYGFLLSIPFSQLPLSDPIYLGLFIFCLALHIVAAVYVEKQLLLREQSCGSKAKCNDHLPIILIGSNLAAVLLLPSWIVCTRLYHPALGSLALCISLILIMKLVSYHAVNKELRSLYLANEKETAYKSCSYPKNLSVGNFVYFWFAPTLCYQPVYPRSGRFHKSFFLKRMVEFAAASAMVYILIEQYTRPTVQNSIKPLNELNAIGVIERILKVSLSSLFIWLLGFYAFFHSFLNAIAELLCFGDRQFYRAWWNARGIDEYWRYWNIPVHLWLKRHVQQPLTSRFSPGTSQLIIFFLSAAAHEFLVAVPTGVFQGWAFIGMLFQVPLITLTSWYMKQWPHSSAGNYLFWITFCILGQPMCILLYYRAWINKTLL